MLRILYQKPLLFFLILLFSLSCFLYAEENTFYYESRSKDDLIRMWQKLKPIKQCVEYSKKPVFKKPFFPGQLTSAFLKDGLNYLNFVRYLAGLPADLEMNDDFNKAAQAAAFLSALNRDLSHYPKKYPGFSDELYNLAKVGAVNSHLDICCSLKTLPGSIDDYINNIRTASLGHRYHLLRPNLDAVGFGFSNSGKKGAASATYTQYYLRNRIYDYDFCSWPVKGWFPVRFFQKSDMFTWSIDLNHRKYNFTKKILSRVRITIERITSEGNSTVFKLHPLVNGNYDKPGRFFGSSLTGKTRYELIFRPGPIPDIRAGDRFNVKVQGLKTHAGQPAQIEYSFELFTLE